MRLDVYLKLSRLLPKRNVAREFAKAGKIEINGKIAKASSSVNIGDIIKINRRNSLTSVSVKTVPASKQVAKKNAGELYELLAFEKTDPLDI